MRSLGIVVPEPGTQRAGSPPRAAVRVGVGPLAQQRLDEALGLPVGLRPIGPRPQVSGAMSATGVPKAVRHVGRAVIGHHAFDTDPRLAKPVNGAPEEADGGRRVLIVEHFDIRRPTEIIDADVNRFPPETADAPPAIAMNAMTHDPDPPDALHIEVEQFARPGALIP